MPLTTTFTRHFMIVLCTAVLMAACSAPAPRTAGPEIETSIDDGQAEREPEVSDITPLLDAARQALSLNSTEQAASILREIAPGKLIPDDLARYCLTRSRLHYIDGDVIAAQSSLEAALAHSADIAPALRWQLHWQRLMFMAQTATPLYAAEQADGLLRGTADESRRATLSSQLWRWLQDSSIATLQQARAEASSEQWRGWLELALIDSRALASPQQHSTDLSDWLARHGDHPAANQLPGGLAMLPELSDLRPRKVALLLPLSDRLKAAGTAVLDGYLAAYYESLARGWPAQQISVLDSTRWVDVNQAYAAAVEAGAELVIGPLTKQDLAQWQQVALPVPILALNHFQVPPLDKQGVYQFGLAPADEARQLADVAFRGGGRRALVIRPQGPWGAAMAADLGARWSSLNGKLYATAVYSEPEEYSASLQLALGLDRSEQRAREIRQLMGVDMEFQPRRREDIDTVFLLSGQPNEARAIKPLLSFHYAGDLPVYSTSHIFSGRRDATSDRDLNGINLIEIPWLLQDDPVKAAVNTAGAVESLSAMYALGADAFLLHWRLPQLANSPDNRLRGYTGLLSMDGEGILHRQLTPAIIRRGEPLEADAEG